MNETVPAKLVLDKECDLVSYRYHRVSKRRLGILFPTGHLVSLRADKLVEVRIVRSEQIRWDLAVVNGFVQVPKYLFEAIDSIPPDMEVLERYLPSFIAGLHVPDPLGLTDPRPLGSVMK